MTVCICFDHQLTVCICFGHQLTVCIRMVISWLCVYVDCVDTYGHLSWLCVYVMVICWLYVYVWSSVDCVYKCICNGHLFTVCIPGADRVFQFRGVKYNITPRSTIFQLKTEGLLRLCQSIFHGGGKKQATREETTGLPQVNWQTFS